MLFFSSSRQPGRLRVLTPFLMLGFLSLGFHAHAQKPVYRCEVGGKVGYSDAPCVGAKEVDVTPTQGMDKMTGNSHKGADVRREEYDSTMADALKPLTGMAPDQYRVYRRRFKLSPADKAECARLDAHLPQLKQRTIAAQPGEKEKTEVELYKARSLFNDLNC